MVQMILARRFFGLQEEREKLPPGGSGLPVFKIGPSNEISYVILHMPEDFEGERPWANTGCFTRLKDSSAPRGIQFFSQHGTWEEQRIELSANQNDQGDDVHPHQERDADPKRSIENAVIREALQIPPE